MRQGGGEGFRATFDYHLWNFLILAKAAKTACTIDLDRKPINLLIA